MANAEEVYARFNTHSAFMYMGFLCTTLTLFTAGVITTAAFVLMMRLSQTASISIQGTHYTTLATLEVSGKLVFAWVSGVLVDTYGISNTFLLFFGLGLASILLTSLMPHTVTKVHSNKVDQAKPRTTGGKTGRKTVQ